MNEPSIMADAFMASAMGCAGDLVVRTPALDRLAARGTLFENANAPRPMRVPARAAFQTARRSAFFDYARLPGKVRCGGEMPGTLR